VLAEVQVRLCCVSVMSVACDKQGRVHSAGESALLQCMSASQTKTSSF